MISKNPAIASARQLRAAALVSSPNNDRTALTVPHQNAVGMTTISTRLLSSSTITPNDPLSAGPGGAIAATKWGNTTGTEPVERR
jgi:hypothetical protein